MGKVLVVIDMQNDFVTGILGSPDAQAAVEPVLALVESAEAAGTPVIFTMDTHLEADYSGDPPSVEAARIPRHCVKGTSGWEIVPALAPHAKVVVEKPSFLSLHLQDTVRELGGDAPDITLCGVCTDICVVSNALTLRGHFPAGTISVFAAGCGGTSAENHQGALNVMKSCLIDII